MKSCIAFLLFGQIMAAPAQAPLRRLRLDNKAVVQEHEPNINEFVLLEQENFGRILNEAFSFSFSMSMDVTSCVDPDLPDFIIEDSVDVKGDILIDFEDSGAKSCGDDCYTVKDNGTDPPFDPDNDGDTLQFAYRRVTGDFTLRSKVCGVNCEPSTWYPNEDAIGRCALMGLVMREDDNFGFPSKSRTLFAGFEPYFGYHYYYRLENGDNRTEISGPFDATDGDPNPNCYWITLQRSGNDFEFWYQSEGSDECDIGGLLNSFGPGDGFPEDLSKEILVGLGVATPVPDYNPEGPNTYRLSTEAKFSSIRLTFP